MTTVPDRDLLSIGLVATHVQRPVRRIEQVVAELKITAAMRINGTVYFDANQVAAITAAIKGS